MPYTSHGYMTAADLAEHHVLYDTGRHPNCPGHTDDGGDTYHCRAVEDCPGRSEDDEEGLTEAGLCTVDGATGWCVTHRCYEG